ncbi:hypothetical protein IW148_002223 [Coemansia sp. RSA 1199]|nr:hypothetical protein IW148_002223 [Coemansia sp. RSA 1199]
MFGLHLTVWCLEINKDLEDQDRVDTAKVGLEDLGRAGIIKEGQDLEDLEGLACVRHRVEDLVDLVDTDSSKDLEDLEDLADSVSSKDLEVLAVMDNKALEDPVDPVATDSKALDPVNNAPPKTPLARTG